MVIAVDFDGTIVKHRYPAIGEELPFAVQTLKMLRDEGHRLILWTVREREELEAAVLWCRERGVAVLLSTHRIEQAEKICDHIFLVHKGKVLIDAPKQSALTDKDNPMMFEITTLGPIEDAEEFHLQQCIGETYTYWVLPSKIDHPALVDAFQKKLVLGLKRSELSLNDLFIHTVTQE